MKLLNQSGGSWKYALNQNEFDLLCHLLKKFPHTEIIPTKISQTDTNPKSVEREHLLNESMAEYRGELKRQAVNLIAGNKLKKSKEQHLLTLTAEDREIMLQILNEIRVGCWRALNEPESLASPNPNCSVQEHKYYNLMNLAGYFQHELIGYE